LKWTDSERQRAGDIYIYWREEWRVREENTREKKSGDMIDNLMGGTNIRTNEKKSRGQS